MNRVCISFSTKDKVELSKRTVVLLLQPDKFDLQWVDGSDTLEGQERPEQYNHGMHVCSGVKGGADIMLAYSLTEMLKGDYDVVGLVESDVLLDADWFEPTMALFEKGREAGLDVGAVSPRSYVDRVLIQRHGWAVMLNQGAGAILMTRRAAELVLDNFRTGWWPHTRSTFMRLAGIDIGRFAAFRGNEQWTSTDWLWDALLASHGLASLALTPSKADMIGQSPPLAEQGLHLTGHAIDGRFDPRIFEPRFNDEAFATFAERTRWIRQGIVDFKCPVRDIAPYIDGNQMIFPQHAHKFGVTYFGNWRLQWEQGFGPFAYRAGEGGASLVAPCYGSISFLVSGGAKGARCKVHDAISDYTLERDLPGVNETGVVSIPIPGSVTYRDLHLELAEGGTFYGYASPEEQPHRPDFRFDYFQLPPV